MHRSARLPADLRPTALAARLAAEEGATDLTLSNPTLCGFDYPEALLREALADPRALLYAPAPLGLEETRIAIARESRTGVGAEDVVVTASSSESYALLFKLLADPGDRVAVMSPSYPLFEHLARLEGLRVTPLGIHYTQDTGRWTLDLGALAAALADPTTRAVVVVNPNNPTGSCLSPDERAGLLELCRAHQVPLIADEVFGPYGFSSALLSSVGPVGEEGPLTFILDGLSKRGGLPQLKLGWLELHGPARARAAAREGLAFIADTYLSVSTPIQLAAGRLLPALASVTEQIASRVRVNREHLAAALVDLPEASLLPAAGGWYGLIRLPQIISDEEWVLTLAKGDGVIVQPGFFYDFESPGYLVVSLLPPAPVFATGIAHLTTGVHNVIHSK